MLGVIYGGNMENSPTHEINKEIPAYIAAFFSSRRWDCQTKMFKPRHFKRLWLKEEWFKPGIESALGLRMMFWDRSYLAKKTTDLQICIRNRFRFERTPVIVDDNANCFEIALLPLDALTTLLVEHELDQMKNAKHQQIS